MKRIFEKKVDCIIYIKILLLIKGIKIYLKIFFLIFIYLFYSLIYLFCGNFLFK